MLLLPARVRLLNSCLAVKTVLWKRRKHSKADNIYAATKQAKESLGLNYANWCGVDFVALRFASIAGPWRGRWWRGQALHFVLRSTTLLRAGPQQFQPGSGVALCQDAARAVQLVLNAEKLHSRVFNVGMGKIYIPEEIVSEVLKIMPRLSQWSSFGADALPIPPLSLGRIRREQHEPEFDMATAIHDYACWAKALTANKLHTRYLNCLTLPLMQKR